MKYVLDACAILAFLNKEAGADIVADLIIRAENGTTLLYMSSVQALEVYYDRIYIKGCDYADMFLDYLCNSAIKIIYPFSQAEIAIAGRLKTSYRISLADSIACATAVNLSIPLVTSDHSELDQVEKTEPIQFLWIR